MRSLERVRYGSDGCIIDANEAEEELRDDITEWLRAISSPPSFGRVREISAIHVYDSVTEYFGKFREEFYTDSLFTIREMEVMFFEELESWLDVLRERVCDIRDEAEDVLEETEPNGSDIDGSLDSWNCEDVERLLNESQSVYDEAYDILIDIKEVLDELYELKGSNGQNKRLVMYVPIEEKIDLCCDR